MNKQLSELIEWMEKESKTVEELNHHNILREGKYVMIQRILSKAKSLQSEEQDGWISVEEQNKMWQSVYKIVMDTGNLYSFEKEKAIEIIMSKYKIKEHGMGTGS